MRRLAIAYAATLIVMFAFDFCWLSVMGSRLYKPRLGEMMLDQPVIWAAVVFYLIYVSGVVGLVVTPALRAESWTTALGLGALFGLAAYATYDMTNQATLRNWSSVITIADLAWGTFLTSISATAGYLAAQRWG